MFQPIHRHLIATGYQTRPYKKKDIPKVTKWFNEIVELVDMNILVPPKVIYCDTFGNEGITGFTVIDTSHISGHWWEAPKPFFKLDLYSCKDFDEDVVINHIKELDCFTISYSVINREFDDRPKIHSKTITF